ncbi:MAG: hypothetical protein L6Q37_07255 [Bdellovibrionaceae bacterium]|nr:hypothetical protein [Pseudobdellovibrionaceae bacterium]NUM60293.1 hypothetical protein [Pseudobdellovibrionaceae bacterium]
MFRGCRLNFFTFACLSFNFLIGYCANAQAEPVNVANLYFNNQHPHSFLEKTTPLIIQQTDGHSSTPSNIPWEFVVPDMFLIIGSDSNRLSISEIVYTPLARHHYIHSGLSPPQSLALIAV